MTKKEYLLTVLIEECAEVAQRACKALRFGLDEVQPGQSDNNLRRLERELADLMAVSDELGLMILIKDKAEKLEKLNKYMDYSRELGIIK